MNQHSTVNAAPAGNPVIPALRRASAATGVDFNFLLEQARTESSLDPKARATTSTARGLFQFIEGTWLDVVDKYGAKYGLEQQAQAIRRDAGGRPVVADAAQRAAILRLREDPYISGVMAGELARENASVLQQQLGRPAKPGELYMAHFLGARGAARFLDGLQRNPDLAASHVLPGAARANEAVFFKRGHALSLHQVYARFDDKFNAMDAMALQPTELAAAPGDRRVAAAASSDPAAASLAAHATQLAALATLQLGRAATEGPASLEAAAMQPATRGSAPTGSATAGTLTLRAATTDSSLRLVDSGQATLFSLQVLQSLTLPGERNAQQQRRWLA